MRSAGKVFSLLVALLTLVSASRFSIGVHFCSDELKHVALLEKAQACEAEEKLPPCHRNTTSSCCDDEQIVHENLEDALTSYTQDLPFFDVLADDVFEPTRTLLPLARPAPITQDHSPPSPERVYLTLRKLLI